MQRLYITLLTTLILASLLSPGCAPQEKQLVVGFVPSVETQTIIGELDKFDSELSKRIGMKVKSEVMPYYAACVEAMGAGQVDVAFLPPMAYVLGHQRHGIEVLLKVERKGKTVYRGEIIVRNDSGIDTLEGLQGKKIGFVEPASASGYLYAKALLAEHGVDLTDSSDLVLFTGSHPTVVQAVVQGTVDAGACYDDARQQAVDIAPDVMEVTKILAYTDDIPSDTVSVTKDLDPELTAKIATALKEMASGKEGPLYAIYQIEALHDAQNSDYDPLRKVGKILDLNFEELLKDE